VALVRDYRFTFSADNSARWCPHSVEFSHVASGFFAGLPYLEPYFTHNVREAAAKLGGAQAEARLFMGQESLHAREHRRYNDALRARYPGLGSFEQALVSKLEHSKARHSLAYRMAFTAGYEAVTYQLVCFMLEHRHTWLRDADPSVLAFVLWHAAEEVEHKSVAYDLFNAVHGGYWLRLRGFFAALIGSLRDLRAIARHLLEADGQWQDAACRKRMRTLRIALARQLVPRFRHYLLPSYHPSQHRDPREVEVWATHDRRGTDLRSVSLAAFDRLVVEFVAD
jgi:predicted metal-dependent hydrolase